MVDNIAVGGDGQANHTLAVMRHETREGVLQSQTEFLPGLTLHADPALELHGNWRAPEGRVLELSARMGAGPGGWVGLHLGLPSEDLRRAGVIGFAARIAASEVQMVRAALRSGTEGGFEDCFFDKHLLFRPEEASHLDAMHIHHRAGLPVQAPWRELILFLPTRDFDLSLIDLRVFVV